MSSRYDILDDELEAVKSGMTNHDAFYAIMVCAMMSDGERDKREREALEALAHRTVALYDLYTKDRKKFDEMVASIEAKFKDHSGKELEGELLVKKAIEVATEAASVVSKEKEMAYSAYAHAVDLVFADSVVQTPEKRFLKHVAEKLDINPNDALEVLRVLARKNKF